MKLLVVLALLPHGAIAWDSRAKLPPRLDKLEVRANGRVLPLRSDESVCSQTYASRRVSVRIATCDKGRGSRAHVQAANFSGRRVQLRIRYG